MIESIPPGMLLVLGALLVPLLKGRAQQADFPHRLHQSRIETLLSEVVDDPGKEFLGSEIAGGLRNHSLFIL